MPLGGMTSSGESIITLALGLNCLNILLWLLIIV